MSAEEHKLQGHLVFQGLRVAVENRKGSVRSGVDAGGKPWRTVMKAPYGYLKGTRGADGEEVDVFVGPDKKAPNAYVVHQHKSSGKGYDEDKVILGVPDETAAKKLYLAHYDSRKFLGPVKEVPLERLKQLMDEGKPMKKIALNIPSLGSLRSGINAAAGKLSPTLAKPVSQVASGVAGGVGQAAGRAAGAVGQAGQAFGQAAGRVGTAVKNEASSLAHNVSAALPQDMSHVTPGHFMEGVGQHLMGKLPTSSNPLVQKAVSFVPKALNAGANFALGTPKLADFDKQAFIDELAKLGAISDEEAAKALERYEALEKAKPTAGQVGRYGAIGAAGNIGIGALGDVISGSPVLGGPGKRLRGMVGRGVTGALSAGAIPLLRQVSDRHAELGKLKSYMDQPHLEQERSIHTAGKLTPPFEPAEKVAMDIRRADVPGMGGLLGKYFNPAQVAAHPVLQSVAKGRAHLMVEKPIEEVRQMFQGRPDFANNPGLLEQAAQAAKKGIRRHELTHYLRGKAGKMEGYGEPGLRNVLRTGREEAVAHMEGLKPFEKTGPKLMLQAAQGVVPGALTSVQHAYPGGVADAALGGTLKPLRPIAKRLGLVKNAFNTNEYSGPMGPVSFRQHSGVPPMKVPGLRAAVEAPSANNIVTKLGSGATTAAGRLASSMKIGLPKVTAPSGPSIAQVAKPVGFGRPLAGANKSTI